MEGQRWRRGVRVRRDEGCTGGCIKCRSTEHWSRDCPSSSSNPNEPSPNLVATQPLGKPWRPPSPPLRRLRERGSSSPRSSCTRRMALVMWFAISPAPSSIAAAAMK
ncbi:hypothetical protein ZIOFF_037700 [Zingiber officinale]|uniref:CCHC-type domain-containing protein n=1 Tax=Zingiber officinale TaxID=94328 RepID=A0A8J5L3V9_ZINOF|nr:hypothetical protein ZIOFF_037700 [Zingiber officinale]